MRILTFSTLIILAIITARNAFATPDVLNPAATDLTIDTLQEELKRQPATTSPLTFYNNSYAWLIINSRSYREKLIANNCNNGQLEHALIAYMPQSGNGRAKFFMMKKGSNCN